MDSINALKKSLESRKLEKTASQPNFYSNRLCSIATLERKHSSGDLQSRLKTRKILGVGETDNGDVHRSKISQVLGHNEHLFVKLPRCYGWWHLGLALVFSVAGGTNLLSPFLKPYSFFERETLEPMELMTILYGSLLLGFAFLLWIFFGTTDKSIARGLMSAIAVAIFPQLVALLTFGNRSDLCDKHMHTDIFIRLFLLLGCVYFFWAIGSSRAGLRKSLSNKDLRERPTPDDQHSSPASPIAKQPDKKTD